MLKRYCWLVAMLIALLTASSEALAQFQAYSNAGTGTQVWGGELGMEFTVNMPIVITHLGVFDSGQNGLQVPLVANLWNTTTQANVATQSFAALSPEPLQGGHRFKALPTPVALNSGFTGTISASGYGTGLENNGNAGTGGPVGTTNNGGGLISFGTAARYSNGPNVFPGNIDGGPGNRYASGSFIFRAAVAQLTVTTTDNSGGVVAPTTTALDFGVLRIGASSVKSITAVHTGDQFMPLSGSIADAPSGFTAGGIVNFTNIMTGSSSAPQAITYSATGHTSASGSVVVSSTTAGNVTVNLSGRGVGPEFLAQLDPLGGNTTLSPNPGGSVIDAGTTSGNDVSQSDVIRISNVSPDVAGPGFDPLTSSLENMTVEALISGADAAQFTVYQTPDNGATLLPFSGIELSQNEFIDLVVQFTGGDAMGLGNKGALLTINTDVGAALGDTTLGSAFSFDLTATATPEPATMLLWSIVGIACIGACAQRYRRKAT